MAPFITRLGAGGGSGGFGFGRRLGGPPTYSVSPSTSSVNEGSSVTFTVTTTNVLSGTTLYWSTNTVSGTINSSDFTDGLLTGSFTVTNNSGSIVRSIANDFTTEGTESFQLQIRTGSTSGTIVATSTTVTINDTSPQPPLVVEYLVIAGGGSGGNMIAGGGGAGGYREGTIPAVLGSNYPVSVGAGGFIPSIYDPQTTGNGSNSVFSTITSTGGGKGGGVHSPPSWGIAANGGSGGGGNTTAFNSQGAGNTPPTTPPQGNPGGYGNSTPRYQGGGGGGALEAGIDGGAPTPVPGQFTPAGRGGNGKTSTITGSSVTRAGGGGGGYGYGSPPTVPTLPTAPGGAGGGGAGGPGAAGGRGPGSNGSVNTGGGGGGASSTDFGSPYPLGGGGGSGIVILRYPQYHTIANPGGGLTISTYPVGTDRVSEITAGTGNVSWS